VSHEISGAVLRRGDEGYEELRRRGHNERKPERFPELIVRPESEQDVVAAVELARREGLKVKARSGGHSWTASSVRDGLLVDLELLDEITVDPEARTATVQPGVQGRELGRALREHGLFFPGGHCPTVCVGGYLLQGGFGWNGRSYGPACASVRAVDVVTADGELLHADATQNTDYLWAARGAGPGYFGIVTRFHLDVYERPRALYRSLYVYPLDVLDEVLRFTIEIAAAMPPELEIALLGTTPRLPDGSTAPGGTKLAIAAAALSRTEEDARAALALLEECPVLERAEVREVAVPTEMEELYGGADALEPAGYRYAVDNMWTDAGPDELLPAVRDLFLTVPNGMSHVFWLIWRPHRLPDMAFSVEATHYIAAFSAWHDPAEDAAMETWPLEHMRRLEPLSVGIQLADENLVNRRARFLSDENLARLEELRAKHDPDGVFHSYLIAPAGGDAAPL
jgi:FAD/FMN-containing dehydrogenase